MNNNYIGENIKIYRERKNYTQRELGDKIGKTWEMISRYERGESSPFNQLDNLANALDVDPRDLLKDTSASDNYSTNKVPFFDSIPKDFNFENSYIYYPAPDWMIRIDRDLFAVNSDIVERKKNGNVKGCVFVAPNAEIKKGDLVLVRDMNKLIIKEFKGRLPNIVGKLIAKEVRFV